MLNMYKGNRRRLRVGKDPKRPARVETCKKIKKNDHFASVCKTKSKKPKGNQAQEEKLANGEQVDYAFRVTTYS